MKSARTQMTDEDKGKILGFKEYLNAEQISIKMRRSPTTIRRFLAKYKKTKKIKNLRRSGRLQALNNTEKEALIQKTIVARHKPLREIIENLELKCSMSTARNVLHDAGIQSYIAAKKPFISEKQALARVNWCEKNKKKSIYDWWRTIFSDETCVEIGKQSRQIRVWRYTGERYDVECLTPTFKSGRRSLMVWGCFVGEIKGPLIFCDEIKEEKEKISANIYLKILESYFLPFKHTAHELVGGGVMFQQDNAPIHTARIVTKWFETNNIKIIDWPAASPDLNPIENIWKLLKNNVQKRDNFPRTISDLKIALKEEWAKCDTSILRDIIDSMPRRITAVLQSKGGPTKY